MVTVHGHEFFSQFQTSAPQPSQPGDALYVTTMNNAMVRSRRTIDASRRASLRLARDVPRSKGVLAHSRERNRLEATEPRGRSRYLP